MIEKRCLCCGDNFTAKRNHAKYCSDNCKMEFHNHGTRFQQAMMQAASALTQLPELMRHNPQWAQDASDKSIAELVRLADAVSRAHYRLTEQSQLDMIGAIEAQADTADALIEFMRDGTIRRLAGRDTVTNADIHTELELLILENRADMPQLSTRYKQMGKIDILNLIKGIMHAVTNADTPDAPDAPGKLP